MTQIVNKPVEYGDILNKAQINIKLYGSHILSNMYSETPGFKYIVHQKGGLLTTLESSGCFLMGLLWLRAKCSLTRTNIEQPASEEAI